MVCAKVSLDKSAEDVSLLAKSDLKANKANSDLRPLGPPRSAVAPLSVPDQGSSALTKRVKKPAFIGKSPCTQTNLEFGGGKIKLMVRLASFSLAKLASSSQSRFSLVGRT